MTITRRILSFKIYLVLSWRDIPHKITRVEDAQSERAVTYPEQRNFVVQFGSIGALINYRSILSIFLLRQTDAASVSIMRRAANQSAATRPVP